MAFSPTSPVSVVTPSISGFTSPTWTLTADSAPPANSKAWTISAIGGTQPAGVHAHSLSNPFTLSMSRPAKIRTPNYAIDSATGRVVGSVAKNTYRMTVRVGTPITSSGNAGAIDIAKVVVSMDVGAGADVYGLDALKSAILLALSAAAQQASGLADTAGSGSI